RATLFGVVVGEDHAFLRDPVDIRRAVTKHTHRVGADIGLANVVAKDNKEIGLAASCCLLCPRPYHLGHGCWHECRGGGERRACEQQTAPIEELILTSAVRLVSVRIVGAHSSSLSDFEAVQNECVIDNSPPPSG